MSWFSSKAIETGIIIVILHVTCYKLILKVQSKSSHDCAAPGSSSNLLKGLLIAKNSETFIYFTKITAVTWSINKVVPVSIALDSSSIFFCFKLQLFQLPRTSMAE